MNFALPDDKQWLTAAEAAKAKLPEFPQSKRHVNRVVSEAGIHCRNRKAVGGGREFHWTDLPPAAREEWLKRHGVADAGANLPADRKAREAIKSTRADARFLIIEACAAYVATSNATKKKALSAFCAVYQERKAKLPEWVYAHEPSVDSHQLRRWDRIIRQNGEGALVDRRGRPAGTTIFDRDLSLKGFVVSTFTARPQLSCRHLQRAVAADLQKHIPLRTLQAFMASLRRDHAPEIKAMTNPDAFRSHHQPAFGSRGADVTAINQRWEIDGTRADAMCLMPDGTRRRMALIALIDVFTRRAMVLVCPEGSAAATKALLRRAILAWGVPNILKADNGKDFIAADVRAFLRATGIELKLSRVFSPEQKPFIERFIGSMNRGQFPLLPGFVGHNVGERKAIEARESYAHRFGEERRLAIETTLTPEGLQARIDLWLRDIYEQELHSGIGTTPAARAAAFTDQVRRIGDERALDALLMPPADGNGLRTVQKKGIRIANRYYIAPELGAIMGHHVHVRLDPMDLSRIVVYRREGGEFFCIAEDASLIGNDRLMEVAAKARATSRKHLRVIVSDNHAAQKLFPSAGLHDRILADAGGDGFVASDDAREAMTAAAAPRLIEQARAIAAMDEAKAGPQHIAPTQEEIAGAAEHFVELRARSAPPAERMEQRDGYQRPAFIDDEPGFFHWAAARDAAGEPMDADDRAGFEELKADNSFQLLLRASKKQAG